MQLCVWYSSNAKCVVLKGISFAAFFSADVILSCCVKLTSV